MMPTDYTQLTDAELMAARNQAWAAYYAAATHYDPNRDYSKPGLRFQELEAASERLDAISSEIERRYSCVHVEKVLEHTYGTHIYMQMLLDGVPEEIDVYCSDNGPEYRTTSDANPIRRELIISAYHHLY